MGSCEDAALAAHATMTVRFVRSGYGTAFAFLYVFGCSVRFVALACLGVVWRSAVLCQLLALEPSIGATPGLSRILHITIRFFKSPYAIGLTLFADVMFASLHIILLRGPMTTPRERFATATVHLLAALVLLVLLWGGNIVLFQLHHIIIAVLIALAMTLNPSGRLNRGIVPYHLSNKSVYDTVYDEKSPSSSPTTYRGKSPVSMRSMASLPSAIAAAPATLRTHSSANVVDIDD